MARLPEGEYERRVRQVVRVLWQHRHGLREQEIAELLGWERRSVNNYLHSLERKASAYREGRLWFADHG